MKNTDENINENIDEQRKKQSKTRGLIPFKKGQSGNPKGRPKNSVDFVVQLKQALKKVEKEKGISLIEFAVQKAYTNPQVLVAMLKKVLPDMTLQDVKVENINPYENVPDIKIIEEFENELEYLRAKTINNKTNPFKETQC